MKKYIIAGLLFAALNVHAGTVIVVNDAQKIDLGDATDKRIDDYLSSHKVAGKDRDEQIINLLAQLLNDAVVQNDRNVAFSAKRLEALAAQDAITPLVDPATDVKPVK